MNEEIQQPEEETEGGFRKINSSDTWRDNGNGIARVLNSRASSRLEVAPECDRCDDALWVLMPVGGAETLVPCGCEASQSDSRSRLQTYSQLGFLERMTFETLMPEGRRGRVDKQLFVAAVNAAKDFSDRPEGWLVLDGITGSGKTHLAASIVNAILEREEPAKYISALGIPDMIRNERFENDDGAVGGSFESLMDAPVLVIDDLGAQQTGSWFDSKFDQLLTHRFNGRMPTVVVLAKTVSEMPERIALKLDDPGFSKIVALSMSEASNNVQSVNIPKTMLDRMTFESFDPNGTDGANDAERFALANAYQAAREFVLNPEKWLYLHGPTGRGKTHLSVAIANAYIQRGDPIAYWIVPKLLAALRQTFSGPNELSYFSLFDSVLDAETLVLDDLCSQRMTDWAIEQLYQIISHRYDHRLPTVITSQFVIWEGANNRQWQYLKDSLLWESMVSRLHDQHMVTERLMAAPDYRNRGA